MSAENQRNDPDEKHYSAWLINIVFAVIVVYLLCRMYKKRFCRNLNRYGQDYQGFVRRPDIYFHQVILSASETTQYLLSTVVICFWLA